MITLALALFASLSALAQEVAEPAPRCLNQDQMHVYSCQVGTTPDYIGCPERGQWRCVHSYLGYGVGSVRCSGERGGVQVRVSLDDSLMGRTVTVLDPHERRPPGMPPFTQIYQARLSEVVCPMHTIPRRPPRRACGRGGSHRQIEASLASRNFACTGRCPYGEARLEWAEGAPDTGAATLTLSGGHEEALTMTVRCEVTAE